MDTSTTNNDTQNIINIPAVVGSDVEIEYEGNGKLIVRWNYPDGLTSRNAGRPFVVSRQDFMELIGPMGVVTKTNVNAIANALKCCERTVWTLWAETKKARASG